MNEQWSTTKLQLMPFRTRSVIALHHGLVKALRREATTSFIQISWNSRKFRQCNALGLRVNKTETINTNRQSETFFHASKTDQILLHACLIHLSLSTLITPYRRCKRYQHSFKQIIHQAWSSQSIIKNNPLEIVFNTFCWLERKR